MPINNSYSQTPKRIFTNKPFIKGMNYTNADLEPYVCRAVANLELESSNSATKTRMGINNNIIGKLGEVPCKFYNKIILFSNLISEYEYEHNIYDFSSTNFGFRVLDSDNKECDLCNTIYSNNTELNWVLNDLDPKGDVGQSINGLKLFILCADNGIIPHCINPEDYSITFFSIIANSSALVYKGMLKAYYHSTAKKIILSKIIFNQVDINNVNTYGVNLASPNPQIYKDYVPFAEHDFYKDYMGINNSKDIKNVIAIETVALYDSEVAPSPYATISANAKMLYGINASDTEHDVYIRPYYVMPYGHYGAVITANNKYGTKLYYDFTNKTFKYGNMITSNVNESYNISVPTNNIRTSNDTLRNTIKNEEVTVTNYDLPDLKLIAFSANNEVVEPSNASFDLQFKLKTQAIDIYKCSGNGTDSNITGSYTYNLTTTKLTAHAHTLLNSLDNTSITESSSTIKPFIYSEQEGMYINKLYITKEPTSFDSDGTSYKIALLVKKQITVYNPTYTTSTSGISASITGFPSAIKLYRYPNNDGDYAGDDYTPVRHELQFTKQGTDSYSVTFNSIESYLNGYKITYTLDYKVLYTSNVSDSVIEDWISDIIGEVLAADDNDSAYIKVDVGNSDATLYRNLRIYDFGITSSQLNTTIFGSTSYTNNFTFDTATEINGLTISVTNTRNVISSVSGAMTEIVTETQATYNNLFESLCERIKYNNDSYDYDTDFTALSFTQLNNALFFGTADNISKDISVRFNTTREDIKSDFVYVVQESNNTRHFNIPISQYAISTVDSSSINIELFEIINSTENAYSYIDYNKITSKLYSIRIDGTASIEYDKSDIPNIFKSSALNICNHLGHTVVWDGSNNNSLCYSAYGDPSYFPANYIITLDNPIVYAYPHNGNLVIFTTDDIYLLHSGNVPSTNDTDGREIPFTQTLIQANTRLGKANINTVRSIGKDVFFINNNNKGYLIKPNKYVNNAADVYMIKMTSQIDDLLDNPFNYAIERFYKWNKVGYDTITSLSVKPVTMTLSEFNTLKSDWAGQILEPNKSECYVYDGDTIYINTVGYRFCDIDTPELSSNDRLSNTAKQVLNHIITNANSITFLISGDVDNPNSETPRQLVYVFATTQTNVISISTTMLYNGLAKFYNENHDKTSNNYLINKNLMAYNNALVNKRGIHNDADYTEGQYTYASSVAINDMYTYKSENSWISNTNNLYVYTTNSYIYIFQAMHLGYKQSLTIIYKYSIDNKTWTSYDIPWYILPTDIANDINMMGFKMLTANDNLLHIPSVASFINSKQDVIYTSYLGTKDNYSLTKNETVTAKDINVYFDSGNQSISIMNDKLFREIKLSVGPLPDSLLNMNYSIDLYTDGKLVVPNQLATCNLHSHNTPFNTHYKGKQENVNGFQKITFFAPARGRIPRVVFSLDCKSDVNILEYAIVYMQLNAK